MNIGPVRWPVGLPSFYKAVDKAIGKILGGRLLVIDPSSGSKDSMPGYAVFDGGTYKESGVIKIPLTLTIDGRLRFLYDKLADLYLRHQPTLLVVEEIHKPLGHINLLWSVGVTMAAVRAEVIQLPIPVWKAVSKIVASYSKGDEADARIMGDALIKLARERAGG